MFRRFAVSVPGGADKLFIEHPSVLALLLEMAWRCRLHHDSESTGRDILGTPHHRSNIPQLPTEWLEALRKALTMDKKDEEWRFDCPTWEGPGGWPVLTESDGPDDRSTGLKLRGAIAFPKPGVFWDHLIYAYMIENTRIYEIFRRILDEFVHGEKFGVPTAGAQHWLRNTEELFYSDPVPLSIMDVSSHIRPDLRASRRNAYNRMFGMDLNHGSDDGKPYSYPKAAAYNNEFVTAFEEFLREAWVAISNKQNSSGPNPTDRAKIESIVKNLQNMLLTRRQNGNLSREEFVHVSTMSWFHLTVMYNSPIVTALRAEAASPEQRLFKIAQRVGLPAHGLSNSYFEIADSISRILIHIEAGGLQSLPTTPHVFSASVEKALNTIITHWSVITGRDVKAGKVAVR
jgi:hypothetical protein